MAKAQAKSRLKRAIKHPPPKMYRCTYAPGNKELVWPENIVNSGVEDFIVQFIVLHHDERSKIVTIDQYGVIKRYSTSHIRPFLEQASMLDDSIIERKSRTAIRKSTGI